MRARYGIALLVLGSLLGVFAVLNLLAGHVGASLLQVIAALGFVFFGARDVRSGR